MSDTPAPRRNPAEIAERLQRRRTFFFWLEGLLFLLWQGMFLYQGGREMDAPMRLVDQVRITWFLIWAVLLLALLATGGGLMLRRDVRALLQDESTVVHRRSAFAWGYWAAMAGVLGAYALSLYEPISVFQVVHMVLTCGIAVPLLRFALLERRAARG